MAEFEIGGKNYRSGKLGAMAQFHLSRRIAPIIPTLIPVFVKLSKGGLNQDLSGFADVLGPFALGLSEMTDEAGEYIIGACLSVVQRNSGKSWVPVWSMQAKGPMFEDIEMDAMIKITVRVIQDNLGPFIKGILTGQ